MTAHLKKEGVINKLYVIMIMLLVLMELIQPHS